MSHPSQHGSPPSEVHLLRWPHAHPLPEAEVLGFFNARGLHPTRWSNGPGEVYAVHSHSYHKTLFCLQGSITFSLPDHSRDLELHQGDRLIIPPGIRHSAVVGPEGVTCIEAGEP